MKQYVKPIVTIGIPVFNGQEWLVDAIESALAQPDICEVIVVNDGSTDASSEIAKGYKGVKVIDQVNKGLASARNTAIMNMKGDYFLPLDADDILLENYVAEAIQMFSITGADVVAPSFKEFGMGSAEIILMQEPKIEDFKTGNRIGYCALIRKDALLEVGGYNPKMIWGAEDYDLWFDLLKRDRKIVTIPKPLWLYRIREGSMWKETQKHYAEFMNQIKINHPEIYANN